jgi:multidrug efflux pump subunit AcrB
MAVVFAMLTSYLLTRTLVPTMVHYMLPPEVALYQQGEHGQAAKSEGIIWRIHHAFNERFEQLRQWYCHLLDWALHRRALVLIVIGAFYAASLLLVFIVGRDFFPYVDSG